MANNKTVVATEAHMHEELDEKGERDTYSPREHALVGFCLTKWPTLGDIFGYL